MIGTLIQIVLVLIVLGVIIWGIQRLLPLLSPYLPSPIYTIVHVVLVIIIVLIVVWVIAGLLGIATPVRL